MGQSSGLSPRAKLDVVSGSPGVSPSRVFIHRGEVGNVMANSCEKAGFGSHDKPLMICRGPLITHEKPTIDSRNASIVATPAVFTRPLRG
jgi:hypothetical protein